MFARSDAEYNEINFQVKILKVKMDGYSNQIRWPTKGNAEKIIFNLFRNLSTGLETLRGKCHYNNNIRIFIVLQFIQLD